MQSMEKMRSQHDTRHQTNRRAEKFREAVLAAALVAVASGVPHAAQAASNTWDGSTNSVWSVGTNWLTDPAVAPGTSDTATFNGAGNGNTTIDLGSGVTLNTIVFDSPLAAGYTIGSGLLNSQALTLNHGGAVTMNAPVANSQWVNAALTLGTDATAATFSLTNNSALNSLSFAGNIAGANFAGNRTLVVGGSGAIQISGGIGNGGGTLALNKTGLGTVSLAGQNTYTGATTIAGGTLKLDFASASAPLSNILNAASGVTLGAVGSAGGTLAIVGKDATASTQTIASLALGAGANKILLTPGVSGGTLGLTITAAHVAPANTVHASLQFSPTGVITYTNTASLNQFVNGQFNYYGTFGTDSWARITANTVTAIAGTDVMTDFTAGGDNNVTASFTTGTGVDPNSIRFASASNLTITQNNTGFFVGGILVASTAGTSAINGSGTLRPFGSGSGTVPTDWHVIQNSPNAFTLGIAVNNNSASRPMSLVKSGAGTLILNAANGYTGGTYLHEGTVQVGNGGTAGALGTGGVVNSGSLIFNRSNDFTDSNAISGAGTVTKQGTGALVRNAASTYTGGTVINAGVLEVANATALGTGAVAVNAGELALNSGLTLANNLAINGGTISPNNGASIYSGTVSIDANGMTVATRNWWQPATANNVTLSNTVSGTGGLIKTGGGLLTLLGNNTYAGGTTISAGQVAAGTLTALGSGGLVIGSGATLSLNNSNLTVGAVTLGGGANIVLGTIANTISSTGDVNVSGTNNLLTLGGGAAAAGNTYSLLSGSVVSASGISLTGSAVAGQTIALGDTVTVGRTNYQFISTATALQLGVTGGAFNLTWNGGSGHWNTTDANWQQDGTGANIAFFADDNVTISTPGSITVAAGGVTAGTLAVNNSTGTTALSGGAVNTTAFTKSGLGTLQLDNTLTSSGGMTLTGGSITGSGVLTATGGVFDLRDGSLGAILNGSVGLTKTTNGVVTLSAANSYTGSTAINAGTLVVSGSGTLGNGAALSMGGGALNLGGTSQVVGAVSLAEAASGNTIENGSLTGTSYSVSNASGNAVVTADLLANGVIGLNKTGAGTLTLKGANTYTGSTAIRAGSLVLDGGTDRLLNTNAVVLGDTAATAKLVLGGSTAVNQTLSSLTATGLGGSVVGGNAANSTLTLNVAAGTSFFPATLTFGGTGTYENNLALVKDGAGTVQLEAANTFAGGTTVKAGVLALKNAGNAAGSGTIMLENAARLHLVSGNPAIFVGNAIALSGANANATFSSGNAASAFSGAISGSVNQTLTLSSIGGQQVDLSATTKQLQNFYGTVDVAGTLRFSASTLGAAGNVNGSDNALFNVTGFVSTRNEGAISLGALNGNGIITAGSNRDPLNAAVTTFTIGARGTNATFGGNIQDSLVNKASVVKTGNAVQTFTGNNLYTGETIVNGGKLTIDSTTTAAALSGTTSVTVTPTLTENTVLELISAAAAGSTVNLINDSASLSLSSSDSFSGLINLAFTDSTVTEQIGSMFINNMAQPTGVYSAFSAPIGADQAATSFFTGSGSLQVVPEPSSLGLIGLGAATLLRRRRRCEI